ncbi:spore germination protein [Alkaliphilus peptidifermentans]|uniref:Spore germination protein KA n=1 Tax=Alkaliphilus peptidifermentans DSM 18978 TaxID=1120976 RepID=A0A1G5C0K3_9FIRM|nr:spore germination protein [Alkaliphilus peptidifermentans]SCX95820.1 spore germination protein KA [Alkaliphilus peptidifermentans DSM 18978]
MKQKEPSTDSKEILSKLNLENLYIDASLQYNIDHLKIILEGCTDVVYREITLSRADTQLKCLLLFTDGLVDSLNINENIIKPLNSIYKFNVAPFCDEKITLESITDYININEFEKIKNYKEIIDGIFSGDTVLMLQGFNEALMLNTKGWEARSLEEPAAESLIRGPREGFTESFRTNTGLIRRKLKDPKLKIKELTIGSRTNTSVGVLYMEDIVNKDALDEVIQKLQEIKIDGIFESGYLEQFLENNTYSPFPQLQVTERPDKVCGNLLEGRIAILTDGAPQALILPISFFQLFQSPEDYNERYMFGNLTRWLRYIGFFIATSFPSIYVALISFHQEMIPADLMLDLAKTRTQVPFPPVVEAILMELTIEFLREASARLPRTIGQTIGIVGAIVIGDAAVRANLASPAMVIVVAITAIGSYVMPHYSTTYPLRSIRFPMIFMAATFGAFGIIVTWIWIIIHLCSLDSLGYPYLSPLAPLNDDLLNDVLIRRPLWKIRRRPKTSNKNSYRW